MGIPYAGEIIGLATAFCWSFSSFIWARVSKKLTPFAINSVKAIIGFVGVSLVALFAAGQIWPTGLTQAQLWILIGSGVVGLGIGDGFYFIALEKMGPRRSLLMWLTAPAMAAILGMIFLEERINALGWTGMAITLAGIAVVQMDRQHKDDKDVPLTRKVIIWGTVAGFIASLGQAISSAMTKVVLNDDIDAVQVAQMRLFGGAVFLMAGCLILRKTRVWFSPLKDMGTLRTTMIAVFIGTILGLIGMTFSQKLIDIGMSNTLTSTSPLFALPLAYFILREKLSARAVVGTILAFVGVAMVFLRGLA